MAHPCSPVVSPQLLTAALATTDTPVAVADALAPDCPLVWVNHAFEAASGYPARHLLGRNARLLQGPDTDAAAVRHLGTALAVGRQARVRLLNYRPDGST